MHVGRGRVWRASGRVWMLAGFSSTIADKSCDHWGTWDLVSITDSCVFQHHLGSFWTQCVDNLLMSSQDASSEVLRPQAVWFSSDEYKSNVNFPQAGSPFGWRTVPGQPPFSSVFLLRAHRPSWQKNEATMASPPCDDGLIGLWGCGCLYGI